MSALQSFQNEYCTNQPPCQKWLHPKSSEVPSFFALSMPHNPAAMLFETDKEYHEFHFNNI